MQQLPELVKFIPHNSIIVAYAEIFILFSVFQVLWCYLIYPWFHDKNEFFLACCCPILKHSSSFSSTSRTSNYHFHFAFWLFIICNVGWNFNKGEQLFENYGQPNHIYFTYHGFSLPDKENSHDCVLFEFNLSAQEMNRVNWDAEHVRGIAQVRVLQ